MDRSTDCAVDRTQKVSTVKLLHRKVSILRSFWENLHWTEKIYTGTAGGAGDKYQVCLGGGVIRTMPKFKHFLNSEVFPLSSK